MCVSFRINFICQILSIVHRTKESASEENLECEEELDECGIFFAMNDALHILKFLCAFFSTLRHNVALLLFDGFEL